MTEEEREKWLLEFPSIIRGEIRMFSKACDTLQTLMDGGKVIYELPYQDKRDEG